MMYAEVAIIILLLIVLFLQNQTGRLVARVLDQQLSESQRIVNLVSAVSDDVAEIGEANQANQKEEDYEEAKEEGRVQDHDQWRQDPIEEQANGLYGGAEDEDLLRGSVGSEELLEDEPSVTREEYSIALSELQRLRPFATNLSRLSGPQIKELTMAIQRNENIVEEYESSVANTK